MRIRKTAAPARRALFLALLAVLPGCASLGGLGNVLQAPTFRVDESQQAQLRILPPSPQRPRGGASVRLFARVGNPNPLGLTLTTLAGQLELEGRRAADVSFPLGVPLSANGEAVVPLDIAINFDDLPSLGSTLLSAVTGRSIGYRLNGTVGVNAGLLGTPSFGPTSLLSGSLRVTR